MNTYTTEVISSYAETSSTHVIRLAKPDGFDFQTSQAVRFFLDTPAEQLYHPLSIASSPTRNYLEFAVRHSDSAFKQAFFALRVGDAVTIFGPRGQFFLDTTRPAVLLAGGIGITPLKSMVEYATDMQLPIPLTFIYSNRSPDEIPFREDLNTLAQRNPYLRLIHTITRPSDTHSWTGRIGRINVEHLRELVAEQPEANYYLCGTPGLVDDTTQLLRQLDVSPNHILQETFKGYVRRPPVLGT